MTSELLHMKAMIRDEVKAFYKALSKEAYRERCEQVSKQFLKVLVHWSPGVWGVFNPFKDEPDWRVYLQDGDEKFGHSFFYCDWTESDGSMRFINDEDNSEVVPDYLLVPGSAFSKIGERLGRGGGYYDRYLENFQGKACGICFTDQLRDNLPKENHDMPVHALITEKQFIEVI